jgi:hypothetical protein
MYNNAEGIDYLYMFLGSLGAMVTGISFPIFSVLMGQMLDNLNDSPNSFSDAVAKICIIFCILAGINIFAGFFQVSPNFPPTFINLFLQHFI